uniref:Uncharacterized protein n=1 Tax=Triticum urartu TaxID=4572 RepID=A0A8R7PG70_TRIUA
KPGSTLVAAWATVNVQLFPCLPKHARLCTTEDVYTTVPVLPVPRARKRFKPSTAHLHPATAAKQFASRLPDPEPAAGATELDRSPSATPTPRASIHSPQIHLPDGRPSQSRIVSHEARRRRSPSTRSAPRPAPPPRAAQQARAPPRGSRTAQPQSTTPSGTQAPCPRPRSRTPWPLRPAGASRGRPREGASAARPSSRQAERPPRLPPTPTSSAPSTRPCYAPSLPPRSWGWSRPWSTRPAPAPRRLARTRPR